MENNEALIVRLESWINNATRNIERNTDIFLAALSDNDAELQDAALERINIDSAKMIAWREVINVIS